jgi:hypothetical protein
LLDQGEATRGLAAKIPGQHAIVSRPRQIGPDPRVHITPFGGTYERNRWEALPHGRTLIELVDVMNSDLSV